MGSAWEMHLVTDPPRQQIDALIAKLKEQRREEVLREAELLAEDFPGSHTVFAILASAQRGSGRSEAAVLSYRRMIALRPDQAATHYALGTLLQAQDLFEEAAASYGHAVHLQPDFAEAHNNLGSSLRSLGRYEEAVGCYERAVAAKPELAQCWNNLGAALRHCGRRQEAIAACRRAVTINPGFAEAYNNLGNILRAVSRNEDAIACYRRAVVIRPDFVEAITGLASLLQDMGRLDEALAGWDRALEIQPDHVSAEIGRLYLRALQCDWRTAAQNADRLADLGVKGEVVSPFMTIALEDEPARQLIRARRFAATFRSAPLSPRPMPSARPARLRIGYLSADFRNHPVGKLLIRLIERHDRSRFEVFGYSMGAPADDDLRRRFVQAFDRFEDVDPLGDHAVAERLRRDAIDIVVDLAGYTTGSRPGILAHRPADVQISYLGYPGSMGAPFIDYIVADKMLIPPDAQRFYSEKILYLPDQYQVQDELSESPGRIPTRAELGLPENAFIFCAINNSYKLTADLFGIWMDLLAKVEASVLWLLAPNPVVESNLRREARERGIDPTRLIFAGKRPYQEYVAQFAQADLFLDSFVYNAGATASDALQAGLPIITRPGQGYTARMAASLLTAIGLQELIAKDEEDYRQLALDLARDPARLARIRQSLAINCRTMPLFDTARFTANLEVGYDRAFEIAMRGEQPRHIML